jgi:hypothetical protein
MNNGKQKALPRWDTPHKREDWNEKKERPDAGMILKRNKKAEAVVDPRPFDIVSKNLHNHLPQNQEKHCD